MSTPELVKWIPEYMWHKKQIIDFIVFYDDWEHNTRFCLMYQRLGNINFQSWPYRCTLLPTVDSAIQSKGACWNFPFPFPFPGRYIGQVSGLFYSICHALAHAFHGGCIAISLLGFCKIVRLLYFNYAVEPWLTILLHCTFVFVLFYLDYILFIFQACIRQCTLPRVLWVGCPTNIISKQTKHKYLRMC